MIQFRITPFLNSEKYSLQLDDFEPQGGYDFFLRAVCEHLNESFLDWYQGVESGIGHITYRGYTLTVYWTDYPFSLSFDCRDQLMAQELQMKLEGFFSVRKAH
jgi:hypothetical protein